MVVIVVLALVVVVVVVVFVLVPVVVMVAVLVLMVVLNWGMETEEMFFTLRFSRSHKYLCIRSENVDSYVGTEFLN